jgi:N6-L-threonylcarbamoyladenine synthase
MLILGLESSCDETSVALLDNGKVLANTIFTQKIHSNYGGVVPEIASRAHIQKIDRLAVSTLAECGVKIPDIGLIAVTDRPGLAGALLVGISFALGLHCGYSIPVIGVNHLEGHIASVTLEHPEIQFPVIALVVSGGHTALYRVDDFGTYTLLGQTVDDAAGEAFDKIGKMMGFAYPAGREIELTAGQYSGTDPIRFPIARVGTTGLDFSFSGLKTAVKYYLASQSPEFIQENKTRICYSFQKTIVDSLVKNAIAARDLTGIDRLVLVGGVACNTPLRNALRQQFGPQVFFPSPRLCTDNAAMIAKAGFENFSRGRLRFPKMDPAGAL